MKELKFYFDHLKIYPSYQEKVKFLLSQSYIQTFFSKKHSFEKFFSALPIVEQYIFLALLILKQGDFIFASPFVEADRKLILSMFEKLKVLEDFYASIGGIIGYHLTFLEHLNTEALIEKREFLQPKTFEITKDDIEEDLLIQEGIAFLDQIAFILPVGGAGDRLGLIEEKTKRPLPAALFNFWSKSLLQWLFEEVQALEALFFKKTGKKISIPMVLMTSDEKENHLLLTQFLEEKNYFSKDPVDIFICKQPLVPMISESGRWSLNKPYELNLKPGGHGALWKVLEMQKGFDFLFSKEKSFAIIRQINNPIGGLDKNILALLSFGVNNRKAFGFTTCDRLVKSASGMVVLEKKIRKDHFLFSHVNIEYSDFKNFHLFDQPRSEDSPYSEYPANANILFIDLKQTYEKIKKDPFHGFILNIKHQMEWTDENGVKKIEKMGRPELMMQNLSLAFSFSTKEDHIDEKKLLTFLISNKQEKTLSPIKKLHSSTSSFLETPLSCQLDLLKSFYSILKNSNVSLPDLPNQEELIEKGVSIGLYLSPFLGPLFSEISLKISHGKILKNSNLYLDLADLILSDFELKGSLFIIDNDIKKTKKGRCILKKVKIQNEIFDLSNISLKGLVIELSEGSEFIAQNISFEEEAYFKVPPFHRMIVEKVKKSIHKKVIPLSEHDPVYL